MILSAVLALSLASAQPALAGGPTVEPAVFDPIYFDGVANPMVCEFPVRLEATVNKATIATFKNGMQFISGRNRTKATNLDSGRSLERDSSGLALITPNPTNGTTTMRTLCPSTSRRHDRGPVSDSRL